ncbi:hypothetical protein PBCVCVM1_541R [Paramecium bursaria Chlorella virus CVM-1]|nr:hypothetical protein PBCVCan184_546R [Paramecium bursaria Chlorella virus Can18-4]AGE51874.1 hypothetical protein PBCVCVM1_541R [Paramecium bursaria Chlorella virus CVM-1]
MLTRMFIMPRFTRPSVEVKKSTPPRRLVAHQPLEQKVKFDLEVTEFEVRVIISASVLLFSMGMLATHRGEPGVYMPLITSIIGYWTPSPSKKE